MPWLFDGLLKQWTEQIGLDWDLLSSVPVWVRFSSLYLNLWSKPILSKFASLCWYSFVYEQCYC